LIENKNVQKYPKKLLLKLEIILKFIRT